MFCIFFSFSLSLYLAPKEIQMSLSNKEKAYIILLGKRIVHLRKERNMMQIELAAILNIEDSALRRIESGRTNPTIKTLLRIAEALDVALIDLLHY